MNSIRQIAPNVLSFLERAADLHADSERRKFLDQMGASLLEAGMESPIEDLFWTSFNALCAAHYLEVNPDPEFGVKGEPVPGYGVYVTPQAKIGKYRVDFLVQQNGIGPDEHLRPVIVELDGHDFHDKSKQQRSYEKARDRALIKAGYRVLHYTGSDIFADPFAVAHEVLVMLGGDALTLDSNYRADSPLGNV